MKKCKTEILPILFREYSLLMLAVYRPFWNNTQEHESAIDCITEIVDFVNSNEVFTSDLRIILCDDFNDLVKIC